MIKQLENPNGSHVNYLADLIITNIEIVPASALAEITLAYQQRSPITRFKAWLFGQEIKPYSKSKGQFFKVSFASETEPIEGKIYLAKHVLDMTEQMDNYGRGDVISLIIAWGDHAMVYNHDTHVLNHCFDVERFQFMAFRKRFPLRYGCRIIEEAARCFPAAHKNGDFAKRGVAPRAKHSYSEVPIYPDYSQYDKFQDVFKAVILWLTVAGKLLLLSFVVGFFLFIFYLIISSAIS